MRGALGHPGGGGTVYEVQWVTLGEGLQYARCIRCMLLVHGGCAVKGQGIFLLLA